MVALASPPAIVMTTVQANRMSAPQSSTENTEQAPPSTVRRRTAFRETRQLGIGYKLGPKTRGARDASRRSRSNRRKA